MKACSAKILLASGITQHICGRALPSCLSRSCVGKCDSKVVLGGFLTPAARSHPAPHSLRLQVATLLPDALLPHTEEVWSRDAAGQPLQKAHRPSAFCLGSPLFRSGGTPRLDQRVFGCRGRLHGRFQVALTRFSRILRSAVANLRTRIRPIRPGTSSSSSRRTPRCGRRRCGTTPCRARPRCPCCARAGFRDDPGISRMGPQP